MTLYFSRVLREFARRTSRTFKSTETCRRIEPRDELVIVHDSDLPEMPGAVRGTHIVRDPRDLVVSAYFYHLRTSEAWCARPNPALRDVPRGTSYREHLRSMDLEEGLHYEMSHASAGVIQAMADWDYDDGRFLELRYEEVLGDEPRTFRDMFRWYGFGEREVRTAVRLARRFSLARTKWRPRNLLGRGHVRKGTRIGGWRRYFTPDLEREFMNHYGDILTFLGYDQALGVRAWGAP